MQNMNATLLKITSYLLTLGAYIFFVAGITFLIILGLDSYKIAEYRAEGNYTAANLFFFKYFLLTLLSTAVAAGMRHYAKKLHHTDAV
jgi:predicted membrane protein